MDEQRYPDLAEIFARKERGRHALAKLSFAEKLDMLDRLRDDQMSTGKAMRQAAKQTLAAENA